MVTILLSAALICFQGTCYNALVASDTPTGQFTFTHYTTDKVGYNGDILVFKEEKNYVWAVHRVWTGRPKEKRMERIRSNDPKYRHITKGCINLLPEVYEKLVECCKNEQLTISK